jgi:hypothetical protein
MGMSALLIRGTAPLMHFAHSSAPSVIFGLGLDSFDGNSMVWHTVEYTLNESNGKERTHGEHPLRGDGG